jgi:adenosylcobinamide kinase/adenosylcobinamide-phosphate guanylyltransferase
MSSSLVVVLGGTRSGKSRYGRDRATALAGDGPVAYLGTIVAGDDELDERVRRHRLDRPAEWTTVEVGAGLRRGDPGRIAGTTILLDGLTLWMSLVFGDDPGPIDDILDGPSRTRSRQSVPMTLRSSLSATRSGSGWCRSSRSAAPSATCSAIAHQRLVARSDEAWFMVAADRLRWSNQRNGERSKATSRRSTRPPWRRARASRSTHEAVGSLGRLERLVEQLAGITGSPTPRIERPAWSCSPEITASRPRASRPTRATSPRRWSPTSSAAGLPSTCSPARPAPSSSSSTWGWRAPRSGRPEGPRLVQARVRSGTRDMTVEPAMDRDEALAAIGVGRDVVGELIAGGC